MQVHHTGLLTGQKITLLVKHTIVGQCLLAVSAQHLSVSNPAGCIAAQCTAFHCLCMPNQQCQPWPLLAGFHHGLQCFITGLLKSGTQQQVFSSVATQGQLGRYQQRGSLCMCLLRGFDNFLCVTAQVSRHKIELSDADRSGHEMCEPCGLSASGYCAEQPVYK